MVNIILPHYVSQYKYSQGMHERQDGTQKSRSPFQHEKTSSHRDHLDNYI